MAENRSPGLRLREQKTPTVVNVGDVISSAAVCGMAGYCEKGPLVPTLCSSSEDFEAIFGKKPSTGFAGSTHLFESVNLFYQQNKNGSLYVTRVVGSGAAAASSQAVTSGGASSAVVYAGVFPINVANNSTFVVTDTGAAHTGTVTFRGAPAKAVCTGGTYAAGASGDSVTLLIRGANGGANQVIDLSGVTTATVAGYAAALNAALIGARAVVNGANIEIISDISGASSGGTVVAVGGTAGAKLGISISTVFTGGTNNVENLAAVTANEFYSLLSTAFSSFATIVLTPDRVVISSLDTGAAATLTVSGTAVAAMTTCTATAYHGSNAAVVSCVTFTATSPGVWGNKISRKVTRVNRTVGYLNTSYGAGLTLSRIPVSSISKVMIGDQVSFTNGSNQTIRGVIASIEVQSPPAIVLKEAVTIPAAGMPSAAAMVLETFDVAIYDESGMLIQTENRMCVDPASGSNYFANKMSSSARKAVKAVAGTLVGAGADARPQNDSIPVFLGGGSDGVAATAADIVGLESDMTGIYAWDRVSDLDVCGIPGLVDFGLDSTSLALTLATLESYLDNRGDVFGIYDGPDGLLPNTDEGQIVSWLLSTAKLVSSQGGMWFPWLVVGHLDGSKVHVPPMGAVMGVIARAHSVRNIGQAPAGEAVGEVKGVIGSAYPLQERQYDLIYPKGINGIYDLPNQGTFLWGNITFDIDGTLQSVNSRIVINKLKRFLKQSTRWVQFEPNDQVTRDMMQRKVEEDLMKVQAARILAGPNPEDGFYIKLDPSTINTKYIKAKVGLRPVEAVEFIEIELFHMVQSA